MKNIAIIIPNLTNGGAERAAGMLSIVLSRHYNVYLFITGDDPITYQYSGTIVKINFSEDYKRIKSKFGIIGRAISKTAYVRAVKRIKHFKRLYNIDTTISFLDTCNLFNLFSRTRDKVILSVRSTRSLQTNTKIAKLENIGIKRFYNRADSIVATSYGVKDDLVNNFGIKEELVATIYNFYDFDNISLNCKKTCPSVITDFIKDRRVISTMGRLIPSKNHLWLIDVCHELFKQEQDVVLIIMGDGELKDDILNRINELHENDRMMLINYQTNPFPIIANSDVFVMATEREGFCNSLVEAMACGTTVISTDCMCSPREIIANMKEYQTKIDKNLYCDRGILVPLGNSEELLKAIKYALDDEDFRMKTIAQEKEYIHSFSSELLEDKWIELVEA